MPMNFRRPRADDVVLGDTGRVPTDGVVLGGLEGVKRRLQSSNEKGRIAALREAPKYGQKGFELVVRIMQGRGGVPKPLQHIAWDLLWTSAIREGKQELLDDLPKFTFDVATVNARGNRVSYQRSTAYCFSEDLDSGVCLEMIAIPDGSFLMGSPATEAERLSHEGPQHLVTVEPFFMGKYPVTQAQWRAVASLPQVYQFLDPDPSHFKGADRPVEQVSWYDAFEFCARLSRKTGRHYRLPSEAEWEYACRAGTTTPFHCGETMTTDVANYNGDYIYGLGYQGNSRGITTPVGRFKVANAFGLYDMHGNVWEWCADSWHNNYEGAPTDGSAWRNNDHRVCPLRGGSWHYPPGRCRSASRNRNNPDGKSYHFGFRVACSTVSDALNRRS